MVVAAGEASCVHAGAAHVDGLLQGEDGEVMVESVGLKARVLEDLDDGVLLVLEPLRGVEPRRVVLSNADLQLAKQRIVNNYLDFN